MLADHDAKVHKTLLITKHYINYFLCSACFNISVYKVILKSRIFATDLQQMRMHNANTLLYILLICFILPIGCSSGLR